MDGRLTVALQVTAVYVVLRTGMVKGWTVEPVVV